MPRGSGAKRKSTAQCPEREREADPGRASWSPETFVIANGLTVAPRVEVRRGGRRATAISIMKKSIPVWLA